MKVTLRNPDRTMDVSGPKTVKALLDRLEIVPEAVLVIRDATLLTRDERLAEDDELEVRPVLSGGSTGEGECSRRVSVRRCSDSPRSAWNLVALLRNSPGEPHSPPPRNAT